MCIRDSVTGVHFNNRSADWLDAPAELTEDWYAAYIQFGRILKRPELELVFRLEPGQCLVMQNDRTLHGRTAFDPNLGRRYLQGCYIDRDAMDSLPGVVSQNRDRTGQGYDRDFQTIIAIEVCGECVYWLVVRHGNIDDDRKLPTAVVSQNAYRAGIPIRCKQVDVTILVNVHRCDEIREILNLSLIHISEPTRPY